MTSSHWMDTQPTVVWACRAWFAATFPLGLVRELERRLSVTIKRMWAACTCIDDMIVHPAARGGRGTCSSPPPKRMAHPVLGV